MQAKELAVGTERVWALVPRGSHLTLISHRTAVTNQILAAARMDRTVGAGR